LMPPSATRRTPPAAKVGSSATGEVASGVTLRGYRLQA
jgi:hypothetical protein